MKNIIVKNFLLGLLFCLPFTVMAQNTIIGDWVFDFNDGSNNIPVKFSVKEDGTYSFDAGLDGALEIEGKYVLEGDQITLEDVRGEYACLNKIGVYKVEVSETQSTLTRVSDSCEIRGGAFNEKIVFTKSK